MTTNFKLLTTTILLSIMAFIANSQDSTVYKSFKYSKGFFVTDFEYVLKEQDPYIYTVERRVNNNMGYKETYSISKLDQDFSEVENNKFEVEYNGKKTNIFDVIYFNDKVCVISLYENKKDDVMTFLLSSFKMDDFSSIETKELFSYDKVNENKDDYSIKKIRHSISHDSSKIGFFLLKPLLKSNPSEVDVVVVDNDLNTISHGSHTLPKHARYDGFESFEVSNKGNSYALFKCRLADSLDVMYSNAVYSYNIFQFDDSNLKEHPLDLGDLFVSDIIMGINRDNIPVVFGYYSLENHYKTSGFFYYNISDNSVKKNTLSDVYTTQLTNTNSNFIRYYSRVVYSDRNNQMYIIGQAHEVREEIVGDVKRRVDYYGDIIVTKLNHDGDVEWTKKLEKKFSSDSKSNKFIFHTGKSGFYIIYNQQTNNINGAAKFLLVPKYEARISKVTTEGGVYTSILSELEGKSHYIDTNASDDSSGSKKFVFMRVNNRKRHFGIITF